MIIARVVGNTWATRRHPALENMKLLLVQAMDGITGKLHGPVMLAVDRHIGAGFGDTVLVMDEGNSARQILGEPSAPIRTIVAGIIDEVIVADKRAKYH
jgi:ethanolamine utilization protein EutN